MIDAYVMDIDENGELVKRLKPAELPELDEEEQTLMDMIHKGTLGE